MIRYKHISEGPIKFKKWRSDGKLDTIENNKIVSVPSSNVNKIMYDDETRDLGPAGPEGPEGPEGPPGTGGESISYQYIQGTIELSVESTLAQLSGLVTYDNGDKYDRYKLKGKATFKNESGTYVLLVGVISIPEGAEIINTANSSTVVAQNVNSFVNTMTPFTVNGLVRSFTTGDIIPLTSAFFILDNSIASRNDYFITLFASSSQIFSGYVEIDLEILISQGASASVTYSN
jgi:hypothetical protein